MRAYHTSTCTSKALANKFNVYIISSFTYIALNGIVLLGKCMYACHHR